MDKKGVLKEFDSEFKELQKKLGFSTSLEELENEFSIKDYVLEMGYVRENFIMQVTSRIIDYFRNWAGYLNSLLVPNPQSYPNQTESKLFNAEEDRKKMWDIVKVCMEFSSMYSFMFLSKDEKLQGEFIDKAYNSWKNIVRPYMSEVMSKVHSGWKGE
jgi:hypothetical protein